MRTDCINKLVCLCYSLSWWSCAYEIRTVQTYVCNSESL